MKWFNKNERLRIWWVNSGAKQILDTNLNRVCIFIEVEKIDKMATDNPGGYLRELECIRDALKNQLYYVVAGDCVWLACAYLNDGEIVQSTIVLRKGKDEFIFDRYEYGTWMKPDGFKWSSFKYASRLEWRTKRGN